MDDTSRAHAQAPRMRVRPPGPTWSIDSAINRAAGGPPIEGNRVELLIDGPDVYDSMIDAITRAERWIHFENYLIRSDSAGWRFAELLAARARDGVKVRVLYDWLGSFGTSRKFWRQLRSAGVEVRSFHPPRVIDVVTNISRNHRKLVVTEAGCAVTGGLCIGCEWTGDDAPDKQPWRDTAVVVDGPAAGALNRSFARTWAVAGGMLPPEDLDVDETPRGGAGVRVMVGEPGRERAYRVIELLAAGTVERLWVTDAYLVGPARLLQAFRDAARDGVDVRLLVPGTSDLPLIRNLTRIGYRDLLRDGVRIYEWDGPMLHAKTIVADSRWVRVGSSNLNPASLLGNFELDLLVEDPAVARALEEQFRRDIARSREVSRRQVRAPRRISRALPMALSRSSPEVTVPPHQQGQREVRRRAVLALRTVAGNARRSVFAPLTVLLIMLAFLFLVLPRVTAPIFGGLCLWFAIGAGREAFRRRADR